MSHTLLESLDRTEVIAGALLLAALLLIWAARKLRRSSQPDKPLARAAMLVGLVWSSEAVWELTGRIESFPTGVRVLVFCVLEIMLLISMMRAERHMRDHGWPGRSGTTAWVIAAVMAVVAASISGSIAEAALRAGVPLLLTLQWWDGVVKDGAKRPEWVTSWRWTPRRLLLWIGAIEPGVRDVDTVHRERLAAQMVRLEFNRRHGTDRQKDRAASRLARLSLDADDEIIGDVRARVDRATWFTDVQGQSTAATPRQPAAATDSVRHRAAWTSRRRHVRTVRITHPATPGPAGQEPDPDKRTAQDLEAVVRAIDATFPGLSQRQMAHLANTTHGKARSAILRVRVQAPTPDPAPRPGAQPVPV